MKMGRAPANVPAPAVAAAGTAPLPPGPGMNMKGMDLGQDNSQPASDMKMGQEDQKMENRTGMTMSPPPTNPSGQPTAGAWACASSTKLTAISF